MATMDLLRDAENTRREFLQVLADKRPRTVALSVEPAKPVTNPIYQTDNRREFSKAMATCPRKDIPNLEEALEEENLYLTTEAGEQGHLPVLILKLKDSKLKQRPAVVFLHTSYTCKEGLRPLLEAYASRGYVAVAVDSRYHGERATYKTMYREALISAWKTGQTMPFIFDTVWDLLKLMDYLSARKDINPSCIGITGISLGGMCAWFAAAADPRYAVVVPIIGVQSFGWAIENNKWHARVATIKDVFEEAKYDLSKYLIDAEVVQIVWDRIAPGLRDKFDAPASIPLIAPRPLLILNGVKDPLCPVEGLEEPMSSATEVYSKADASDKFKTRSDGFEQNRITICYNLIRSQIVQKRTRSYYGLDCCSRSQQKPVNAHLQYKTEFFAERDIGHRMTPFMVKEASDWFDKYLMIEGMDQEQLY